MKSLIQSALAIFIFGLAVSQAHTAFTSFYVFGDGLSCTATNPNLTSVTNYYGKRFSNGRVWVEVLAQQQGLAFNPTNNTNSYFGNTSTNLIAEASNFTPPTDASNALVVIWVNNADLYYPALADTPTTANFNAVINQAQTNHYKAITNLYAKGIRNLVMPNVVDVSTVPAFSDSPYTNVFRQAATNYNAAFYATLNRAKTNCPGLAIYVPDFFTLLTNLQAHPASYGVTNALYDYHDGNGPVSIDAITYFISIKKQTLPLNGQGTNFIFWDQTDPTAMVHNIMAGVAQQMISPVQIGGIAAFNGSNRLDIVNVPVGQNGQVLGVTNLSLGNWATNFSFASTNTAQSVFVPAAAPQSFYRLSFPVVWTWP